MILTAPTSAGKSCLAFMYRMT